LANKLAPSPFLFTRISSRKFPYLSAGGNFQYHILLILFKVFSNFHEPSAYKLMKAVKNTAKGVRL